MPQPDLTGRPLLSSAADARLFVNRQKELKTIEESLEAHMNVLLLGGFGAGKTTLLHQLARRLERRGWRAVFVEGRLATSPSELLALIRARVSPEITVPSIGEQLGAALALATSHTTRRRSTGIAGESELLLDTIRALQQDLRGEERPHAVLLDESSPDIVHAVFGRLRDEVWQLPIVWLIAGHVGDRHIYLRPPADAFFARVITIDALDEKAALLLLRARVPRNLASDRLLKAVVAASSRTPRDLLRLAADVVIGGLPPEQLASMRTKREDVLASLGEPAQRVIAELEAHGPASASDEEFVARLGFGRSRAAQVFAELERLGLVEASIERASGRRPRKVYGLQQASQ